MQLPRIGDACLRSFCLDAKRTKKSRPVSACRPAVQLVSCAGSPALRQTVFYCNAPSGKAALALQTGTPQAKKA